MSSKIVINNVCLKKLNTTSQPSSMVSAKKIYAGLFFHYRYDGPIENMENKYIRLGFDRSGNLLEIMYNEIDEHTVNIFHAMKGISVYYPLLNT
jgi:hypothetical protein